MNSSFVFTSLCLIVLSIHTPLRSEDSLELPSIGEGEFTIVILPDTQYYTGPGTKVSAGEGKSLGKLDDSPYIQAHQDWISQQDLPDDRVANPYLKRHIDWILEHREHERIVFVSHVGDLVDQNTEAEWEVATRQFDRLRGVVPFGISAGNHDMEQNADASRFQAAFPTSSFAGYGWYGGSYEHDRPDRTVSRDNVNSFQIFSAGGIEFLFVHLECNAPDDVLDWANATIRDHPDREVLITTHMDLGIEKKPRTRAGYIEDPKGRMQWTKRHGERGNSPLQFWEKCFSQHSNVCFIFSGDQSRVTAIRRADVGENGNRVHALLSDYHSLGAIRLLRFDPTGNEVEVITYDTALEKLVMATPYVPERGAHQFRVRWR